MSYVFDVDDEVVWSPSLTIGKLFITMVDAMTEGLDWGDQATGFTMMANDYYYVDPQALGVFVRGLLSSSVVYNPTYKELARGFIVACLVLLDRGGVDLAPLEESQQDLFDAKAVMSRTM
jgi:hypothetical protein